MADNTSPQAQPYSRDYVIESMGKMLKALHDKDPKALAAVKEADMDAVMSDEDRRALVIGKLQEAIKEASEESQPQGQRFHSRLPIAGIVQTNLEANVIPELQAFSEGNPVVWIPAGIKGILEHLNAKYPFQLASEKSRIAIPNQCKIALLSDWGADNDHARNVAAQAMLRNPDYMIHLGSLCAGGRFDDVVEWLESAAGFAAMMAVLCLFWQGLC